MKARGDLHRAIALPYDLFRFAQVRYICKDVYGGTDYLPDNVLRYSQDEEKVVRVLERPESREVLGIGESAAAHAQPGHTMQMLTAPVTD